MRRRINLDEDLVTSKIGNRVTSELTNSVLHGLTERAVNLIDIGGFEQCDLNEASIDLLVRLEKLECIDFGRQQVSLITEQGRQNSMSLSDLEKFLSRSASRKNLKEVIASGSLGQNVAPSQQPLFDAFREQNGLAPLKLETLDLSKNRLALGNSWSFLSVVDVSRLTSFLVIDTHVNQPYFVNFLTRATSLQSLAFSFDCFPDEQPWNEQRLHDSEPGPTQVLQLNKQIIRAVGNLERLASLKMNAYFGTNPMCDCRNFHDEMAEMFNKLSRWGSLRELLLFPNLNAGMLMDSIAVALPNLTSLEMSFDNGPAWNVSALNAQKSLVDLRAHFRDRSRSPLLIIPDVMANALSLRSLHLSTSDQAGIWKIELLQIAAFKHLKELVVDWGWWTQWGFEIDDEVLTTWAGSFASELESLAIPVCKKVTDEGVLALLKKAPRLQELDISGAQITDRCLKEIATHHRGIRKLDLSCCDAVTLGGVQNVVDCCVYLKWLCANSFRELKIGNYRKIVLVQDVMSLLGHRYYDYNSLMSIPP